MNTTERVALGMIGHRITPRLAIVTTAIACMLALGTVNAHAQSLTTWTGGGASGDWSTAGNWNGGAPTTTGTWGLTFSGSTQTSSTNTIGGTTDTITLSSLAFNNTAAMALSAAGSRTLTLINNAAVTMNTNPPSGSTTTVNIPITLLGSSTFTINGFRFLRLDGVVSGTGGMSLASGGGTLYLGNNNTFSGGFNLLGSQVDIGANPAFGNGALYLLAGTLNPRGGTKTIANSGTIAGDISLNTNNQGSQLVLNGSFDLNGGTRTLSIGLNSGGAFFGGVLSNGGITKTGSTGLLALSGANTYSGTTTIGSGTLQIGNAGTTGSLNPASVITGSSVATLAFNRTNTITQGTDFNSVIGGAIGVAQVGSGTLVLNGVNTYTGKTIIQSGAVSVATINNANANGNLGTNGTIDLGGSTTTGALVYTGVGETTDRVINLAGTTGGGTLDQSGSGLLRFTSALTTTGSGAKTLTLQGSTAGAGEVSGVIVDYTGAGGPLATGLTKAGSGTWTLSGTNTYSGVTTVNAGVLTVSSLGNGGSNSGIGASSNAAGNLVLGGGSLRYTGATATTDRAFTLTAATTSTIDVATAGNTLTFTGSTASTTGALAKAGSGTLVFTGSAAYTGATAINAGTLQLGNGGTTGALNASSAISGSAGATLAFSRSDTITQGTHFNSVIGGAINVAQIGTGTVTLSGANTYTGTTSVSSGVLVTSTSNRIANNSPIQMTGGTLQFGGDDTVAAIGGTGGTIDVGISRLTSSVTTSSTFSGSLIGNRTAGAGAGFSGFSKTGSGTLTLAGNVSFAANSPTWQNTLQIDGGELVLAGTTTNTSMGTRIYNDSTLRFTSGSHSLGSGGLIVASGQAIVDGGQVNTNSNLGFGNTGTSALTINGGTMTVTTGGINVGNSAFAGSIATLNLNGGLLQVGQILWGGSGSGAVTFNGGTFQMQSTSALPSGTNSVGNFLDLNVGNGGAIIDTGTFSNTIARPLVALGGTATGGLTKLGSATLTLANANTFSGGVTLSAGQFNINHANALGTGTFTISSGTIDNGSGAAITLATNNAQAWNSDFTFVGSSALNLGTGDVTLGANRVVTVTSSTLAVGGAIGGAFTLTKAGAGTLVLSASNARTQATTINAGTISLTGLSGTGTQPSASDLANTPITINAGATLLAGGTVAGQNSHLINQDLTLNGGTLASNGTSGNSNYNFAFGGSSRIIAGGGTTSTISASIGLNGVREFQVGAGSTLTASGRIGNWESQAWGTINKTGDGTLALAANNNLYAGLVLNAGTVAVSSGGWSQNAPGYYSADFQGNATLLWAAGNTFDISASNKFRIGDGVTATLDTGANAVTLGTGIILGTNKTGALTKLGSGTLTISASNAFSGPTTISAGVLAITDKTSLQGTSGVSIAGGAGLRYTGSTDTFGKNITITAGSGTGTITNAGGGLLTLSGNLSKDNSVLRLTGGSFNVTGLITGATPGASDLIVDAATVTLSNTNTYDGPTFVYGSGTLALGIDNAIPNTSRVELGNATTRGTLATGTFSDAISQLVFSGSGGTLRLSGDKTAAAQLATNGSLSLGSNADLVLTSAGTSAGFYRLISAASITGSFASITGTSAAYQVVTTSTSIDYQQRAVLGVVTVTNPATAIITGGSAAFTYSVANGAFSGGASLSVTGTGLSSVAGASAGTAAGGGSTGSLAGLVFTGTGIGANQFGTFGVTAADVFGATTATGTVSGTVLDHATSSLAGTLLTGTTISLGQYNYVTNTWESGDGTGLFSIFNLASTFGASLTADLSLVGVTGTGNGFTTNLATFTDIAGGNSSQFSIFFDPSGLSSSTTKLTTFQIAMSDKTGMSGATATNTLSVTANVIIVPEPGAIALAGIGIAVTGWLARRSRK
jgi:fibronectin-binding autotransporter adhesin